MSVWEGAVAIRREAFDFADGLAGAVLVRPRGHRAGLAGLGRRLPRHATTAEIEVHHPAIQPTRHAEFYRFQARNRVWLARRNLPRADRHRVRRSAGCSSAASGCGRARRSRRRSAATGSASACPAATVGRCAGGPSGGCCWPGTHRSSDCGDQRPATGLGLARSQPHSEKWALTTTPTGVSLLFLTTFRGSVRRPEDESGGERDGDDELGAAGRLEDRDQRRPGGAAEHAAYGRNEQHESDQAEQRPPGRRRGDDEQRQPRRRRSARRTASGLRGRRAGWPASACPTAASPTMSRRLLATRIAQVSAPMPDADGQGTAGHPAQLDVRTVPAHRDQAEEDEDEEPRRARDSRTGACRRCRTRPRARRATPTTSSHQWAVSSDQHQPGQRGDAERDEGGALHQRPAGPRPSRPGAAGRPGRASVPRIAVGVVVGVVDADLQGQADDEGEQRPSGRANPPTKAATPVPARTGEIAAGSVRGRAPATHWAGGGRSTRPRRSSMPFRSGLRRRARSTQPVPVDLATRGAGESGCGATRRVGGRHAPAAIGRDRRAGLPARARGRRRRRRERVGHRDHRRTPLGIGHADHGHGAGPALGPRHARPARPRQVDVQPARDDDVVQPTEHLQPAVAASVRGRGSGTGRRRAPRR